MKLAKTVRKLCIIVFITSCKGNGIFFDLSSQSLKSCESGILTNIDIVKSDYKESFNIIKIPGAEGSNSLDLTNVDKNYIIQNSESKERLSNIPF